MSLVLQLGVAVTAFSLAASMETICHVPPGNPENPQTITVSENAVSKHLENHPGDHVGACTSEDSQPLPAQSDNGSCFYDGSLVTLEFGGSKRLADVVLGERIKTVIDDDRALMSIFSFSEVKLLLHESHNEERANFVKLTTDSGKSIMMTPNHLLPICSSANLSMALELDVGSCVFTVDGGETIVEVSTLKNTGVRSVVTDHKFVVVDGIVASPFARVTKDSKSDVAPKLTNSLRGLVKMTTSARRTSKGEAQ